MMLEKVGTTCQEKQKQDLLGELHASIAMLRAKRDRLCAETAALKVQLGDNVTASLGYNLKYNLKYNFVGSVFQPTPVQFQNLKDKLDQGLPMRDEETHDFMQLEPFLLKSRLAQLKDIQTAYQLTGKNLNKKLVSCQKQSDVKVTMGS